MAGISGERRERPSAVARIVCGAGCAVFQTFRPFLPCKTKGARNAGLLASPRPRVVVLQKPHELQSPRTANCVGVPRAVFAGLLRVRPRWRQGCYPPLVPGPTSRRDATAWASALRATSRAKKRPPLPAPRVVTIAKRPLERDGIPRNIILDRGGIMAGRFFSFRFAAQQLTRRRGDDRPGDRHPAGASCLTVSARKRR